MAVKWKQWKRLDVEDHVREDQGIIAAFSDGTIQHFSFPGGKVVSQFEESKNELFCMDVNPDQTQMVTAGRDCHVRIYDEETEKEGVIMPSIDPSQVEHSKRVFACQFVKDDPNMVLTGGWDRTVKLFDIRAGGPVAYLFGPELSSNSIDSVGNYLVTGSYRVKDSLQVWDWRAQKKLQTIDWEYGITSSENCLLNVASFNQSGDVIFAGGKSQEIKTFEKGFNETTQSEENSFVPHSRQGNWQGSLYCQAKMNMGDAVAIGCEDGIVKVFSVINAQ